jgi:hypothetical protein
VIGNELPCIPALPIYLRNHLSVLLICDVRLRTEKTSLHLEVLLLMVLGINEVADSFGAAEVELALDFDDFGACW